MNKNSKDKAKTRKKRKKQNIVLDYIVYLAVRLIIIVVNCFSPERNLKTANFLGKLMWKHYHRGRKRALDNLHASFTEKDEKWIEQTGLRSFQHLAMMAMDVLMTPRLVRKDNWRKYCRFKNTERAKWMMKENTGLLMVTGHYGNFEIIGYLLGLFDFNIYSIARPLDNIFLSKYLYSVRQQHSQQIIDKKGASALMANLAGSGATVCFIADQDAGRKGIFVDFFGRKASTYKSIALVAVTQNVPIGVGYARRIDNKFFFEIGVNRIITPDQWVEKDDPVYWVTQEYTQAIEEFIREDPAQYWWLHRRWKHRPKNEKD